MPGTGGTGNIVITCYDPACHAGESACLSWTLAADGGNFGNLKFKFIHVSDLSHLTGSSTPSLIRLRGPAGGGLPQWV